MGTSDSAKRAAEPAQAPPAPAAKKPLPPAAGCALAEASARRAERDRVEAGRPKEIQGRGGLEPTRYGDWEIKGIASDF